MEIKTFFDNISCTYSYVVFDKAGSEAIVIDPVLGDTKINNLLNEYSLKLKYLFETHIHADHLTGSFELKKLHPKAQICIHKNVSLVKESFNTKTDITTLFDKLFDDQDIFNFNSQEIKVLHTPGHTPTCSSLLINDHLFTGDTIFMPDFGTGRCDFPNGDAELLYESIQKIYNLSDTTFVHVGHDYAPNGRDYLNLTSVKELKRDNIHINEKVSKEEFVSFRNNRDKTLPAPKLLSQSIKYNLTGIIS